MSRSTIILCAASVAAILSTALVFAADEGEAKEENLVCRYELRPGSHMREHLCATREQWAELRARESAATSAASGNASMGTSGPVAPTVSVIMNR